MNYTFYDLTYSVSKILVLLMVIRLNLNWKLQTQIYQGKIMVVAVDKFGRENFRIQMKPTDDDSDSAMLQGNGTEVVLMEG